MANSTKSEVQPQTPRDNLPKNTPSKPTGNAEKPETEILPSAYYELTENGHEATVRFFDQLTSAIPLQTRKTNKGEVVQIIYPNIIAAARNYKDALTLDYPEATRNIEDLLSQTITVLKHGKLVQLKLAEALVDQQVVIPDSADTSGATTKQQIIGMICSIIVPNAINHVEDEKNLAIKNALPISPLKALPGKAFRSRAGTLAKGTVLGLSILSAIPNYFWFSTHLEQHFPNLWPEISAALSVYLAGALASAVNQYDRRVEAEAMETGRGYLRGTVELLRSQNKSGDRLFKFIPARAVVGATEWIIKKGIGGYRHIKSSLASTPKTSKSLTFTLNPEITEQLYGIKGLVLVLASFWTTGWGYVQVITTQDSFKNSLEVAGKKMADQRTNELGDWLQRLTSTTNNPNNDETVGNIFKGMVEAEGSGKTVSVGSNMIANQTKDGKGQAYNAKKERAPIAIDEMTTKAKAEIARLKTELINDFNSTWLSVAGASLDEKTVSELLKTYGSRYSANRAKSVKNHILKIVQEGAESFGRFSNTEESKSRSYYGLTNPKPVQQYSFNIPEPEFQPIENIEVHLEREAFNLVLERTKKERGELAVLEIFLLGFLITFLMEKGHVLLIPDIAGKSWHKLKNKIRKGQELPYAPQTVKGSMGQQVTLLYPPFRGLAAQGGINALEDGNGHIQDLLNRQGMELATIFTEKLETLNTEFNVLIPGVEAFSLDNIQNTLYNLIEDDTNSPSLLRKALTPIMPKGAKYRRYRYLTQRKYLKEQKKLRNRKRNAITAGISWMINSRKSLTFKDFLGHLYPVEACQDVFLYAKEGKILEASRGIDLAMLVWRKTGGNDAAAREAIKNAAGDWRSVDSIFSIYEAMPEPESKVPKPFYSPPKHDEEPEESEEEEEEEEEQESDESEATESEETEQAPEASKKSGNPGHHKRQTSADIEEIEHKNTPGNSLKDIRNKLSDYYAAGASFINVAVDNLRAGSTPPDTTPKTESGAQNTSRTKGEPESATDESGNNLGSSTPSAYIPAKISTETPPTPKVNRRQDIVEAETQKKEVKGKTMFDIFKFSKELTNPNAEDVVKAAYVLSALVKRKKPLSEDEIYLAQYAHRLIFQGPLDVDKEEALKDPNLFDHEYRSHRAKYFEAIREAGYLNGAYNLNQVENNFLEINNKLNTLFDKPSVEQSQK